MSLSLAVKGAMACMQGLNPAFLETAMRGSQARSYGAVYGPLSMHHMVGNI